MKNKIKFFLQSTIVGLLYQKKFKRLKVKPHLL